MNVMKILKIIPMMILFCVSCQTHNDEEKPAPTYLKGTKWKLVGMVDTSTGELKELKPIDCEECYTLTFDTDYTAAAYSVQTTLQLDLLNLNPDIMLTDLLWCEKYDKDGEYYCDSDYFRSAIIKPKSYSATSDEFKLFSRTIISWKDCKSTVYLLFKPIELCYE